MDWTDIGKLFRESRENGGLRLDEAAKKLCLSKKQILALESGASDPFPGVAARLWCCRRYALALGLDWDSLAAPLPDAESTAVVDNARVTGQPAGNDHTAGNGRRYPQT